MNASSCTVPAFLATQNLWGQHNGGGGMLGVASSSGRPGPGCAGRKEAGHDSGSVNRPGGGAMFVHPVS